MWALMSLYLGNPFRRSPFFLRRFRSSESTRSHFFARFSSPLPSADRLNFFRLAFPSHRLFFFFFLPGHPPPGPFSKGILCLKPLPSRQRPFSAPPRPKSYALRVPVAVHRPPFVHLWYLLYFFVGLSSLSLFSETLWSLLEPDRAPLSSSGRNPEFS